LPLAETYHPQLGVVVSKKFAKQAVKRNRIRRQMSALLACHWPEFNTVLGSQWRCLIAVVRPATLGCTFAQLSQDMAEVVARLKQRHAPRLPATQTLLGD
jgi:ribonuclease P protein component